MIHKNDAKMLTNAVSNFSFMMGRQVTSPPAEQFIDEGDIIKIGNTVELKSFTQGTVRGICLMTDNIIFPAIPFSTAQSAAPIFRAAHTGI